MLMRLSEGDKLGNYQILGSLGPGGRGEVYRARDATLKRDVALRVPLWAPDGRRRGFSAVSVCTIAGGAGSPGNIIVLSASGRLYRVSAAAGTPEPLTEIDERRGEFGLPLPLEAEPHQA
jgi:hypothetical protein